MEDRSNKGRPSIFTLQAASIDLSSHRTRIWESTQRTESCPKSLDVFSIMASGREEEGQHAGQNFLP